MGASMRRLHLIIGCILGLAATAATAQVSVRGYFRKPGTYVAPHVQTRPNSTILDNYSTKPNYNPYTGKTGTVDPYATPNPYRSYNSTPAYPSRPTFTNPYATPKRCTDYYNCR